MARAVAYSAAEVIAAGSARAPKSGDDNGVLTLVPAGDADDPSRCTPFAGGPSASSSLEVKSRWRMSGCFRAFLRGRGSSASTFGLTSTAAEPDALRFSTGLALAADVDAAGSTASALTAGVSRAGLATADVRLIGRDMRAPPAVLATGRGPLVESGSLSDVDEPDGRRRAGAGLGASSAGGDGEALARLAAVAGGRSVGDGRLADGAVTLSAGRATAAGALGVVTLSLVVLDDDAGDVAVEADCTGAAHAGLGGGRAPGPSLDG